MDPRASGCDLVDTQNAGSRDSFGADAVAKVGVFGREAFGCGHVTQVCEGGKSAVPVMVSSSALASKPLDQVPAVEIWGNEGSTKELGTLVD